MYEEVLAGGKGELLAFLQSAFGIHPEVISALVASFECNTTDLGKAMRSLAESLNSDLKATPFLIEVFFDLRKLQKKAPANIPGQTVVLLMRLLKSLFPEFPSLAVKELLELVCLGQFDKAVSIRRDIENYSLSGI